MLCAGCAERGVELVGDVARNTGECYGEVEDDFFCVVEMWAGFELREVQELLFGDSGFSAHGRVDIDSKGAADHHGDFQLREFLEVHGDGALRGGVHVKARGVAEILGIEGADTHANDLAAAEGAFCEEHEDAADEGGMRIALGAGHGEWMMGRQERLFEENGSVEEQNQPRTHHRSDTQRGFLVTKSAFESIFLYSNANALQFGSHGTFSFMAIAEMLLCAAEICANVGMPTFSREFRTRTGRRFVWCACR